MTENQSLIPHIKRAVVTNLLLFLFYMSPSFLSFFALVVALFVVIFDNPYETFKSMINSSKGNDYCETINGMFKNYNSMGLI